MGTYKGRQCYFKENQIDFIDYKNLALLSKFITKYGKIAPKYYKGTSLRKQKELAKAIKNARIMALLPFAK
jgi:small subunit ribosomal protein S18